MKYIAKILICILFLSCCIKADAIEPETFFKVLFEETYNYEDYKMNGLQSKTATFVNKNGSKVWSLRQNTPTMFLNVEKSDRSGFGDVLKMSTSEENGSVFFGNSDSDHLLPEVKENVVVLEYDFKLEQNTLPTYDSYIMWQIMTGSNSEYIIPFVLRRDNNEIHISRSINKNAAVLQKVAFNEGKWFKIRVIFDYNANKWYAQYIAPDKTSVCFIDGLSIIDVFINSGIRSVRTTYDVSGNKKGNPATLFADNFRYYLLENVTSFKQITQTADTYSGLNDFEEYFSQIFKSIVAVNVSCRNALVYGEKTVFDGNNAALKPINQNGVVMVPVKSFLNLFKITAEETAGKVVFEINGNKYEMSANSKIYRKNSADEVLQAKCGYIDGEISASVADLALFLEKEIKCFDNGLIIIAENLPDLYATQAAAIRNRLIYDDPDEETFLADFALKSTAHPRVLVPDSDVFDEIKQKMGSDTEIKGKYDALLKNADKIIAGGHRIYDIANTQTQIQVLRVFRERAEILGMAYHITKKDKYAAYLYEETKIAASVTTDWRTKGYLNAGTLLMGLGIAYDRLYDYLDETQKKQLREEIIQRHIMPGLEAHRGTLVSPSSNWTDVMNTVGWVNWDSNWNIICNSGLMVIATAMMEDEPQLSAEIMTRCYKSLKYYTPAFYPDGASLESMGYLSTVLGDFARVLSTMQANYGTTYGIMQAPGISEIPYVLEYLTGPVAINNFGDAAESVSVQPSETLIFADLLGNANLADLRNRNLEKGKAQLEATDLIWHKSYDSTTEITLDKDMYFRVGETGSMRSSWDDDAMFLSYHAGDNAINHSHMDTGAFVLDALGERWAIDLGSDSLSYNMDPESGMTSRWDLYYLRSEGHNTLTINPDATPGQITDAFSPVINFETGKNGGLSIIDMSSAYKTSASKAHRGYMMHNNRSVVTVRDEVDLIETGDVWWFMHTKADIEISDNGKEACLTQNGKKMYVKLFTNQDLKFTALDAVPFETSPKLNFQASTEGIKKLAVCAKDVNKFEISVSFSASPENLKAITQIDDLEDWSVTNSYTMNYGVFDEGTTLRSTNGGFVSEENNWYTYAKGNFNAVTKKSAGTNKKQGALEIKTENATSSDAFWMWENENFAGKTGKIIQIEQRYFIPSGGACSDGSDAWIRHDNRFGEKMEAVWYAYVLKNGKIMHNNGSEIYADIPFDEWFTVRVVYYIEDGYYDLVLIRENGGRQSLLTARKITNATMLSAMKNGGYKKSRTQLFMNKAVHLYFGEFSVRSLPEYIETVWSNNLSEASVVSGNYKNRFSDNYKLFVAQYKSDKLEKIKIIDVPVLNNGFNVKTFETGIYTAEKEYSAKMFLWQADTFNPILSTNEIVIN